MTMKLRSIRKIVSEGMKRERETAEELYAKYEYNMNESVTS